MPKRGKRRPRQEVQTVDYRDAEGNVLTLRQELSAKSIKKIGDITPTGAASVDDAWRRRSEMLFERLAVSWDIAGLPLTDQAMLIGRYRMASADEQRWVRKTITTHIERFMPELSEG